MQILCTVISVNMPCRVGASQRYAKLTPSQPSVPLNDATIDAIAVSTSVCPELHSF